MKLTASNNLKPGDVCVYRDDKLVKARKGSKHLAGIWQEASYQFVVRADTGRVERIDLPEGLVIVGYVGVST